MSTDNTGPIDARIDWKREEQIWRLHYNYLLARLRMAVYHCAVKGGPPTFQEGITAELVCDTILLGLDLKYMIGISCLLSRVGCGTRIESTATIHPSGTSLIFLVARFIQGSNAARHLLLTSFTLF